MSSAASSKSKVRELELTPEIIQMGFTTARIVGKLLTLTHKSEAIIQCQFDINNIPASIKKLQNAVNANNKIALDESYHSGKFAVYFTDMLVQSVEQEYAKRESDRTRDQEDKQKIIDEINKDRSNLADISLQDWENSRRQKYWALYNSIKENGLPSLWQPLEFTLSIKCILNISNITLPFAGIILGPPSSLKTVSLTMLKKWPQTYYTDNFSARSLVSHISGKTEQELRDIDMLPHWKNKQVLLPELSPTFTAKEEDLIQLLGILTRILDGQGYISNSGACGQRGYDEKIMFVLTGASVEIPYRVYKALGYLGPKIYFIRQSKESKKRDERFANMGKDFGNKEREVEAALFDYLKWLEIRPDMEVDKESSLPKIKWDYSKDEDKAKYYILDLADLLAPLRGVSQTWETKGTQGSDYSYTIPIIEDTSRAEAQLYNLAQGHALSQGRNYITLEDIPIVIKVVLSTGPVERVKILDKLLSDGGSWTTAQITGSLDISRPTALRTMTELTILGLVDMHPKLGTEDVIEYNEEKKIRLKPEFLDWLRTDEFKQLRGGFVPATDDTDDTDDEEGG
jgi:hypothetical protein